MYQVVVQRAVSGFPVPTTAKFKRWVTTALQNKLADAEVTIRIVDKEEMTTLNSTYRQKNKPTNVLSFPFEMPVGVELDLPILGDIVICAQVIEEEAQAQQKVAEAHWAHMVVHGILHLLGHDHEIEAEALIMEAEEITILAKLGFSDPYHLT